MKFRLYRPRRARVASRGASRAEGWRENHCYNRSSRGVAQPGSAPALGAGGRWFKSSRPDQSFQADVAVLKTGENRAKKSPSKQNQLGWGTLRMVAWATRPSET